MSDLMDIGASFGQGVSTGAKLYGTFSQAESDQQQYQQQKELFPLKKEAAQLELNQARSKIHDQQALADIYKNRPSTSTEDTPRVDPESNLQIPSDVFSASLVEGNIAAKELSKAQKEDQDLENKIKSTIYDPGLRSQALKDIHESSKARLAQEKLTATLTKRSTTEMSVLMDTYVKPEAERAKAWENGYNFLKESFKKASRTLNKDALAQMPSVDSQGKPIDKEQILDKLAEEQLKEHGYTKDYSATALDSRIGDLTTYEQRMKLETARTALKHVEEAHEDKVAQNKIARIKAAAASAKGVTTKADKDHWNSLIKNNKNELDAANKTRTEATNEIKRLESRVKASNVIGYGAVKLTPEETQRLALAKQRLSVADKHIEEVNSSTDNARRTLEALTSGKALPEPTPKQATPKASEKAPIIPARPSNAPAGSLYSPSTKTWWKDGKKVG
jgi:hypothetical protein